MSARKPGKTPAPSLTAAQCREVDRHAIEELGIPSIVLMENAGRNAAELIAGWSLRRHLIPKGRPRAGIVCGKGNNGGDGFVIARHLLLRGFDVAVDLAGDPSGLSPDAAVNHAIAQRMGIAIRPLATTAELARAARRWRNCSVLVDALLGTGFTGLVREPLLGIIRRMNAIRGPLLVAIDVPSGLSADAGEPGGVAVEADRTISFVAAKTGFANPAARRYLGRLSVVGIGAPPVRSKARGREQ